MGLGHIAPVTDAGKIFTILFVLNGVGILVAFLIFMAVRGGRRPGGHRRSP